MISKNYESDFFILRTPLLPYSFARNIFEQLKIQDVNPLELYKQLIIKNDLISEALYIASPVLYAQFNRYVNGDDLKKNALRKLEDSLYEYLVRMSSRCTPFGLFAGCTFGTWNETASIRLGNSLKRVMRLDMDYGGELSLHLLKEPSVYRKIKFYTNTSLYEIGKVYRYTEYRFTGQNMRSHHIVSVDKNPVLNLIIKNCYSGLSFFEIVKIVTDFDYTQNEGQSYIEELIQNQVLISEIDANVTGDDFTKRLNFILSEKYKVELPVVQDLQKIERSMHGIDDFANKIEEYKNIFTTLKKYPVRLNEGRVFQIDTYIEPEICNLSLAQKQLIAEGMEVMLKLNPIDEKNKKINTFKNAFYELYEHRIVPLAEVLDTEIGIGYNKAVSVQDSYKSESGIEFNTFTNFKFGKYKEWISKGEGYVTITDEDLLKYGKNNKPLANSISTTISIISEDSDEKIVIRNFGGPSGANMIGRFAYSSKDILSSLIKLCKQEEELEPSRIFAEIIHLPQARLGNILTRPVLRKYEITYLAASVLPVEDQIHISDLYLYMKNGRLVLYSKRLKKEIVPRLSSAHNFRQSLPLYNFLCDLQSQDVQIGSFWDWGFLNNQPHLPRVEYRNCILFPETWFISYNMFASVYKLDKWEEIEPAFKALQIKNKIPDLVLLAESDNQLVLDLGTKFCVQYLLKHIKKTGMARILECYSDKNGLVVQNNNGSFANEFVIPWVKNKGQFTAETKESLPRFKDTLTRKFIPGSEWLYLKIYMSYESSNSILLTTIFPLLKKFHKNNLIDKWFFLRYGDPKHHLRLRIRISDINHYSAILHQLHKALNPFCERNVIKTVQADTYVRELERYGDKTMEVSEYFFFRNSLLICDILKTIQQNTDAKILSFATLIYFDLFLTDCKFSLNEKIQFVSIPAQKFEAVFLVNNKTNKQSVSDYCREINKSLEKYFFSGNQNLEEYPEMMKVRKLMEKYSKYTKQSVLEITLKTNAGIDSSANILLSYMHMFVNRLFNKFIPETEGKLFYTLWKFYQSVRTRNKEL